jgi:hypothetical protein
MAAPSFAYRTFYTWDHSTNWDLTQPGARVGGCHEPYDKPPEAFREDYTRLIDFMQRVGLNHLIIWGALRDAHGGAEALRRLIDYGLARGVRVAPGVGICCYGGVYYEGEHEFSLRALLGQQPDLAAVDAQGRPMLGGANPRCGVACPRNPAVADWTLRSVAWLMQEVGPPAVHFETGDYGICHCDRCRAAGPREGRASAPDMADALPPVVAEVRRFDPDCLLSYNHYFGYTREMMERPPAFARAIPDDVVCKWGVSWMLAPELRTQDFAREATIEPMEPGVRPPTATNMAHLHFGTGWWNCSKRGTLEATRFMHAIPLCRDVGFQGMCTHGEQSRADPAAEMNYHVFAALARDASATPARIAQGALGGMYGSSDLVTDVLTALRDRSVPPDLAPAVARAATAARGRQHVRLNWLTFELHRLIEETRMED